jgi:predicted MFS family arabinose efflux permease
MPPQRITSHPAYPWLVLFLCMLIVAASNAMINTGLTVFDESLLDEFGWSLSALKTRDSITFLGASLLIMGAGYLVDRFGFKPLQLTGLIALAAAYYVYSHATTLWHLYALHIGFAMVAASAGNMTNVIATASWMPERRGLAVGVTIAGTSVGGMLIPPVANALNNALGWREAMQSMALFPLLLAVLVFLLIGNRRSRDGSHSESATEGVSFAQALRSVQFYLIAAAGTFTYFAILALFSHLFLYMRSQGFTTGEASYSLSLLSLAALIGKLGAGWIADRINPFLFFKVQMLIMLAGLIGVAFLPAAIWLFLPLVGFGWGGLHTLYNFILLYMFGLRDAGKINGTVSVGEAAGGAAGIYLVGFVHDAGGGYPGAWLMVVAVMAVGTALIMPLRERDSAASAA